MEVKGDESIDFYVGKGSVQLKVFDSLIVAILLHFVL